MKNERQNLILKIIAENEIETQDDLIGKLKEQGLAVTQATISRDIRDLKLTKALGASGRYCYSIPAGDEHLIPSKFSHKLVEAIMSVTYAQNIIVIKTYAGLANAVATGIDNVDTPEVLGCVAGDDTIFVVTSDSDAADRISENIKDMMKSL